MSSCQPENIYISVSLISIIFIQNEDNVYCTLILHLDEAAVPFVHTRIRKVWFEKQTGIIGCAWKVQ